MSQESRWLSVNKDKDHNNLRLLGGDLRYTDRQILMTTLSSVLIKGNLLQGSLIKGKSLRQQKYIVLTMGSGHLDSSPVTYSPRKVTLSKPFNLWPFFPLLVK